MNQLKFTLAAKTDVGLQRSNNEDNFQVCSDLRFSPMKWVNNEICTLGEKGALLVVADGMGGMNAGEVASQIAIDTIRQEFHPDKITPSVLENRFSIEKHLRQAILKADTNIKDTSAKRPETHGMGTTIVVAWIINDLAYVAWCGDSRAYVFNPIFGLKRLSKDHSYVQQLIDSGKLTEEEATDFPDSNIITRCLSDARQKAEPEILFQPYPLCNGDIVLLCTDGLCGMIRDNKIESVISSEQKDMGKLTDLLVQSALDASGADNVTVAVCRIIDGGAKSNTYFSMLKEKASPKQNLFHYRSVQFLCVLLLCLISFVFGFLLSKHLSSGKDLQQDTDNTEAVTEPVIIQQEPQEPVSGESDSKTAGTGDANYHEPVKSNVKDINLSGKFATPYKKSGEQKDKMEEEGNNELTPNNKNELTPNNKIEESEEDNSDASLTPNKIINPFNSNKE